MSKRITGPKYYLAGKFVDGSWEVLHFGWIPKGTVTETGQPDVLEYDDEAEYLAALRKALAASKHYDRAVLDQPYESVTLAVLRQRSGIVLSRDDDRVVQKYDWMRMD
jgi:hypothetical protein